MSYFIPFYKIKFSVEENEWGERKWNCSVKSLDLLQNKSMNINGKYAKTPNKCSHLPLNREKILLGSFSDKHSLGVIKTQTSDSEIAAKKSRLDSKGSFPSSNLVFLF